MAVHDDCARFAAAYVNVQCSRAANRATAQPGVVVSVALLVRRCVSRVRATDGVALPDV